MTGTGRGATGGAKGQDGAVHSRSRLAGPVATLTGRQPQIAALTSVRGIAALWVAVYHMRDYLPAPISVWSATFFAKGYLAVDLFFVLSGFVIQLNYGPRLATGGMAGLRAFAIARFARVWPLHAIMLFFFLINPVAIALFSHAAMDTEGRYAAFDFMLSLMLVQNWGFTDHLSWNIPDWSISTEFAAYLLFPLASSAILPLARRGLLLVLTALVSIAACAALFHAAGASGIGADIPRLGLWRCLSEFLVGMVTCRLYHLYGPPHLGSQVALVAVAILLTVGTAWFGVPEYITVPAAAACLLIALTGEGGVLVYPFKWRALIYLGEISYAIYLVHYFCKEWIKFLVARDGTPDWVVFVAFITVTLAASAGLYEFFEIPARRWILRRVAGRRETALAPASAA